MTHILLPRFRHTGASPQDRGNHELGEPQGNRLPDLHRCWLLLGQTTDPEDVGAGSDVADATRTDLGASAGSDESVGQPSAPPTSMPAPGVPTSTPPTRCVPTTGESSRYPGEGPPYYPPAKRPTRAVPAPPSTHGPSPAAGVGWGGVGESWATQCVAEIIPRRRNAAPRSSSS